MSHGVPTGPQAKRRVKVSYGPRGEALHVEVDGKAVLDVAPLYGRVQPAECSWSLDGAVLLVNLEKAPPAAPWLDLIRPSEQDASVRHDLRDLIWEDLELPCWSTAVVRPASPFSPMAQSYRQARAFTTI